MCPFNRDYALKNGYVYNLIRRFLNLIALKLSTVIRHIQLPIQPLLNNYLFPDFCSFIGLSKSYLSSAKCHD